MTGRRALVTFLLFGTVCTALVTVQYQRFLDAQAGVDRALTILDSTVAQAARIVELRSLEQRAAEFRRPDQDVIKRISRALSAVGIAESHFVGLQPEADVPLQSASSSPGRLHHRRQTIRATLHRLTIEEVGDFLTAWKANERLWHISQIELNHARGEVEPPRYDLQIHLATIYVSDE